MTDIIPANRDLGRLGESVVTKLCDEVGLIRNSSSSCDMAGWDLYLEHFDLSQDNISDIHRSKLECKIQVKSTDKNTGKWQIELSNLRRLVATPQPAFILFLEFGARNNPVNAYLVHVDSRIQNKVLERVAKEIEKNKSDKKIAWHKKRMTITYGDDSRLPEVTGGALLSEIEKYIGGSLNEYTRKKLKNLEAAGYEGGGLSLELKLDSHGVEQLIDASLGLCNNVPVISMRGVERRFKIKAKSPLFSVENTSVNVKLQENGREGKIVLKESEYLNGYEIPVRVHSSDVFNMISQSHPELFKARICSRYLDIVYSGSQNVKYSFSINPEERLSPAELTEAMMSYELLSAKRKLKCYQLVLGDCDPLTFDPPTDEESLKGDIDNKRALTALNQLSTILRRYHQESSAALSLNELAAQEKNIRTLSFLLNPNPQSMTVTFTPDWRGEQSPDISNIQSMYITNQHCQIGELHIAVIFSIKGNLKNCEDDAETLTLTGIPSVEADICVYGLNTYEENLNKAMSSVKESSSKLINTVIFTS